MSFLEAFVQKKYYFEPLEKITNYVGPKLKASPGNKLKGIWMFTRPYYFDPPISLAAWVYEAQKFSQRNSSQIKSIFMHFFNLHSKYYTFPRIYILCSYCIYNTSIDVQAIKHSFFYTNYLTIMFLKILFFGWVTHVPKIKAEIKGFLLRYPLFLY